LATAVGEAKGFEDEVDIGETNGFLFELPKSSLKQFSNGSFLLSRSIFWSCWLFIIIFANGFVGLVSFVDCTTGKLMEFGARDRDGNGGGRVEGNRGGVNDWVVVVVVVEEEMKGVDKLEVCGVDEVKREDDNVAEEGDGDVKYWFIEECWLLLTMLFFADNDGSGKKVETPLIWLLLLLLLLLFLGVIAFTVEEVVTIDVDDGDGNDAEAEAVIGVGEAWCKACSIAMAKWYGNPMARIWSASNGLSSWTE
jgi:hypothetical protein